jgi:hydroxybutyrate-dimer hydrolase
MSPITRAALAASAFVLALTACHRGGDDFGDPNTLPAYLAGQTLINVTYDGVSDDLLTAGLGKSGLAGAAPVPANAASPTAVELRKIAIYNNYRALVDISANGGYGVLYGPNIDVNGGNTLGEGKVAGDETLVFADDGSGQQNVTLMVQIPTSFNIDAPCIVTATSSGSRGVYGAIATAGEWGLKHGCAVAYTDKGTGNGAHDLAANMVNDIQGVRTPADTLGKKSQFTANLPAADLAAYNGAFPNRWAWKHAHSQQNPEATWGRDTLRAIEFAFWVLNERYGEVHNSTRFKSPKLALDKVIVIASSVSNGAGAAIAALEQDTQGLIDGVAVGEPQLFMNAPAGITIKRGSTTVSSSYKTLYDYFTIANLFEPCAAISAAAADSAGLNIAAIRPDPATAANRCAALAAAGLVSGTTTADQAADAMAKMLAAGWEPEAIPFMATHYTLAVLPVALTYANAYSKSSVKDNLCGYSFAATVPVTGTVTVVSAAAAAQVFGTGNGVPPTSGISIVNNNSVGGAAADALSTSVSTGVKDFNIDGATCLRSLLTATTAAGTTLRSSIDAAKRTGQLRGKPVIIVHGRSDTLVPVNHTSRAYYAFNKSQEPTSGLVYYEVTNAQHFDAFIDNGALPGYDSRLIPLHVYFLRAMDIMYANLKNGTAIPASQVVRTTPRGGTPSAAPAITAANVPPIPATPAAANAITFGSNTLTIPD